MTTPPWLKVTPEQLKEGWVELKGIQMLRRPFKIIQQLPDGNYVVRNPELTILEEELKSKPPLRSRP